jgi:hypothetical protein
LIALTNLLFNKSPFVEVIAKTFIPPRIVPGMSALDVNPVGWVLMENLSGIRTRWTGDQLITFSGFTLHPSHQWRSRMPSGLKLDGLLMFVPFPSFVVCPVRTGD